MPFITYPDALDRLLAPAERQDGYFTTEQAREAGLDSERVVKLAQSGHVERYHHGIYRMTRWPGAKHAGLWPVMLWAQRMSPRAALSHRTALELHGVSDVNSDVIDIMIPPEVRVRAAAPPATVIHRRPIDDDDTELHDGLQVTTLYRTLLDLAVDRIARAEVADVLDRAQQGGAVPPLSDRQLRQVRACYDLAPPTLSFLIDANVYAKLRERE